MEITFVPFVKHIGIQAEDEGVVLECNVEVQNHIQTMHAAAQFALAETQSGVYLGSVFPQYRGKIVPLLRSSSVKFKHPAKTKLRAFASADKQDLEKFEALFERRGRAGVTVSVELKDSEGVVTMTGEFSWFVQKMES